MKYRFSEYGIKDKEVFKRIYSDFIEYCSRYADSGTFSTYTNGEPVFMTHGNELAYGTFKRREVQERNIQNGMSTTMPKSTKR